MTLSLMWMIQRGQPGPLVADKHYEGVVKTFTELELQLALNKCQSPCFQMMWSSVWFDAIRIIMSIDRARILEAIKLCKNFITAESVTLHQLQSLVGICCFMCQNVLLVQELSCPDC